MACCGTGSGPIAEDVRVGSRQSKNHFQIVFLGGSGVGKTSITLRYLQGGQQSIQPESTIGVAFLVKNCQINDRQIHFEIWDTAGQEKFRCLAPMYYRGADACIVVYDVSSPESFTDLHYWYQELEEKLPPEKIVVFAENKIDLERVVPKEDALDFAKKVGHPLMEVSSKTGEGVDELFSMVGFLLTERFSGR